MRRVLVNYADRRFYQAQQRNCASALRVGGFSTCAALRRADLDPAFVERNRRTLSARRGAGYWLWKPYVIAKVLGELELGELLFYSDAGATFVHAIDPLIPILDATPERLLLFSLPPELTHAAWTKRDCFVVMGLDHEPYLSCDQLLASFLVMRKTPAVVEFVDEWLAYATDPRALTDAPNTCGLPNYPNFREHRHDQSVLSLLARKRGVQSIPDISQHGRGRWDPRVPQVIDHTRDGSDPLGTRLASWWRCLWSARG